MPAGTTEAAILEIKEKNAPVEASASRWSNGDQADPWDGSENSL